MTIPTLKDYARFAVNAYDLKPNRDQPLKLLGDWEDYSEWLFRQEKFLDANNVTEKQANPSSGFAARTFFDGTDYVISFRGTDNPSDWMYNILGYGTGTFGIQQFLDAVNYVEAVLASGVPLEKLTFTGHSLGGGLATLMGALYDRQATVFDPAPTLMTSVSVDIPPTLWAPFGATSTISVNGFMELLAKFPRPAHAPILTFGGSVAQRAAFWAARAAANTTQHTVTGEVLSELFPATSMAGALKLQDLGEAPYFLGMTDLHSMSLLALALNRPSFKTLLTDKLPILTQHLLNDDLTGLNNSRQEKDFDVFIRRLINEDVFYANFETAFSKLKGLSVFGLDGRPLQGVAEPLLQAGLITARQRAEDNAVGVSIYGDDPGTISVDYRAVLTRTGGVVGGISTDGSVLSTLAEKADTLAEERGVRRSVLKSALPTGVRRFDRYHFALDTLGSNATGGDTTDLFIGGLQADTFHGGAGNDVLLGGGAGVSGGANRLYGDAGDDILIAGGGQAYLYGGAGTDTFVLGNKVFVEDASTSDVLHWNGSRLTGGVQQSWSESGWAYWTPVTSLVTPMNAGILAGSAFIMDTPFMTSFRYGLTVTGQLLVQSARGLAGQAVIQNYNLDFDTGAATGGIVALKQTFGPGSLPLFRTYLNLAMKAGFGKGLDGQDPLVLDLDGDGLELTREDSSKVYFEMDSDGFAERTAWVKPDDGFLARDVNNNGKVDNASELFGNATTPGFTALKTLDSNADNKISSLDTAWSSLRVWRDLDQDGVTDSGELQTLAASSIREIALTTRAPNPSVIAGNTIRAEATFTRTNNTTGKVGEALLNVNELATKWLGSSTVSSAAAALPNLKGYGRLKDLRIAMTADSTLRSLVTTIKGRAINQPVTILTDTEAMLYRWAGVSGVAATALGTGFDLRKLAFLEVYNGRDMAPRVNGQVSTVNVAQLVDDWNVIVRSSVARILAQTFLGPAATGASYAVDPDVVQSSGADTLVRIFRTVLGSLSTTDVNAARGRWNSWAPLLQGFILSTSRVNNVMASDDFAVAALVGALDGMTSLLSVGDVLAPFAFAGVRMGTTGADALTRDATGKQIFVGGAGNDVLTGGNGQDIYVFGKNFGQDTISDREALGVMSGDRIRFASLRSDEVTLQRSGLDLVIQVKGKTDSVTVRNYYEKVTSFFDWQISPNTRVEDIQFADGVILEGGDIAQAVGKGTAAGETLTGSSLEDYLEGGKGNDTLLGGDQGDIYIFNRGDGVDTVLDDMANPLTSTGDMVIFGEGVSSTDIDLMRPLGTHDLILNIAGGNDQVTIRDQFAMTPLGWDSNFSLDKRIEVFVFNGDGLSWSWKDMQRHLLASLTTSGNDTTTGFGTEDVFESSAGNDVLSGGNGGDTYRIARGAGTDTIADKMTYINLQGTDTIEFAADINPQDVTFSRMLGTDDLLIRLGETGDQVTIRDQFDAANTWVFGVVWFGRIEQFKFADGTVLDWQTVHNRTMIGTAERDRITGAYTADVLDGKAGNDILTGGNGGDTYLFGRGYGYDIIDDGANNVLTPDADTIRFGPSLTLADLRITAAPGTNNMLIDIIGTSDRLEIIGQFNLTETGVFGSIAFNRMENFVFADGSTVAWDQLQNRMVTDARTTGHDTIVGLSNSERLDGGAGNDTLQGMNGSDTYVFAPGSGQDNVQDSANHVLNNGTNILELGTGFTPSNIRFARSSNDLFVYFSGHRDSVRLEDQFYDARYSTTGIDEIHFADGTVWDADRITREQMKFTAGHDYLHGSDTVDLLEGGAGNDTLIGYNEADTYVFKAGYGQDTIEEATNHVLYNGTDVLELDANLTAGNTQFLRYSDDSRDDLHVFFTGSRDSLLLRKQFSDERYYAYGVDEFRFADGAVWDRTRLRIESLKGDAGNNVLCDGDNQGTTLDGGAGNDVLEGGRGSDTYIFKTGYGQDYIQDWDVGTNILQLGPGFTATNIRLIRLDADYALSDVYVYFIGYQESLRLYKQAGDFGLDQIQFADGAVWDRARITQETAKVMADDNTLNGTNGNDTLDGGVGNDLLQGGTGNDTYVFKDGYGFDIIYDSSGTTDVLSLGGQLTAANTELVRMNNDLMLAFTGTGRDEHVVLNGQLIRWAIETIRFADGTQWDAAEMRRRLLRFTANGETITGFGTDDTLEGGAGNDILLGGGGNDTYVFKDGYGNDLIDDGSGTNTLSLGGLLTPANTELVRQGEDLMIAFTGSGRYEHLVLKKQALNWTFGSIRFGDGTVWDAAAMRSRLLVATSGNDTILGFATDDALDGGAGDDVLQGEEGNDTYIFKDGYGFDIITDSNGTADVLSLGGLLTPGITELTRQGDDVMVSFVGRAEHVVLDDQAAYLSTSIETIRFAGGTTWDAAEIRRRLLVSSSGHDTILGFKTADVLDGGAGNDYLLGGDGDDTYIFNSGYGQDVIEDYNRGITLGNTIVFGPELTTANIQLAQAGSDLQITFAGRDERLTVRSHFSSTWQIARFVFADGTLWTPTDIMSRVLSPTAGDDILKGFNSNDRLDGGAGRDLLQGGEGEDTYVFNVGSGVDTIYERGWEDFDTVELGAGFAPGTTRVSRLYNDLILTFDGSADRLIIKDQIDGATPVEFIKFTDGSGTVWNDAAIRARLIQSSAGNDILEGFNSNDSLSGADGNDQLFGCNGNDTLTGGLGNDYLDGGVGTDTAVFSGLRASYALTTSAGGLSFVDDDPITDGYDGIDTLVSVETARFKDKTISLAAPIILDLDGNGVRLVSLQDSKAKIDLDGDGVADRTGWFSRGDGALVYDRDGNGTVTDASELTFINEKPGALSDLEGLRSLDSNGDGVIAASDSAYGKLLMWTDPNGNAKANPREIKSLAQLGISAINLAGTPTNRSWANGENVIINTGTFRRSDGTNGSFADVALFYDASNHNNISNQSVGQLVQAMATFGGVSSASGGQSLNPLQDSASLLVASPFEERRQSV